MSADRWRRIEKLYHSALEQAPDHRAEFLAEACGDDEDLKHALESLLKHSASGGQSSDSPEIPTSAQAPDGRMILHYQVLDRIGVGGMGAVYKAFDVKLGRPVALKFLAPHLLNSIAARRRFQQEARALSALNHPNIATILDVEEDGDVPFLVLEYLPGGTLRSKLRRLASEGRQLPVAQALEYATEIGAGLVHAHHNGVLHRDIKSGNVMFTAEGSLKITDFGLAKFRDTEQLTNTGARMGTVAYMAPERLQGQPADHRSDIFSFGVVLYEMIAGEVPFKGEHEQAIIHQILNVPPRPLKELQPELPEEFERVIERALRKDPAERYQNMEELLRDLTRLREPTLSTVTMLIAPRPKPRIRRATLLIAAAGLIVAVLAMLPAVRRPLMELVSRPASRAEKHLAVLPFITVGGDASDQAFAEGVVETLTSSLTQLERFQGSLLVVPASEVRRQSITSVQEAQRSFGVNLAITGSVQRRGNDVRLTVNLVDARTLLQLGARTTDVRREDLYKLEDRLLDLAAQLLDLQLQPQALSSVGAGGTSVPDAYDAYVQGRGYLRRYDKPGNLERAIASFKQARDRDSRYALAYAGLGEAYLRDFARTKAPEWLELAQEAGNRAVELNDRLAPAHVNLGMTDVAAGRYEAAVDQFRRALDLDSLNADAYRELGAAYEALNRIQDAEATYKRALQLRPNDWLTNSSVGGFYYRIGRLAHAEPLFRKTIDLTPDNHNGYSVLGGLYIVMGKYDQAEPLLKRSLELKPTAGAYSNLGTLYFDRGRFPEAVGMYEKAVELGGENYVIMGNLADSYRLTPSLGQKAEATYRKAIELAEQQLALNQRNAAALSSLAIYHMRLGEKNKALSEAAQALKLAPADTTVGFKAILVEELGGRRSEALATLRELLQHGYTLSQIEHEPELERLRADPGYIRLSKGSRRRNNHEVNRKGDILHHLKFFVDPVDGTKRIIHHDPDHASDDEPGDHFKAKRKEKVRFKCRDGDLTIHFNPSPTNGDATGPFTSGEIDFQVPQGELSDILILKRSAPPDPLYPYTVTVAGVPIDPEIIIDTSGGTGAVAKKKKAKKKK